MPFTLEVSITGLVILAVRSSNAKPTESDLVDVICPNAHMHRPRLSFNPREFRRRVAPDLDIAPTGARIAALDLRSRFLAFTVPDAEGGHCRMQWRREEAETPATDDEERFMDWLPTLATLGFESFTMPQTGVLPAGASARITLPPGEIVSANVIRDEDTTKYLRYDFVGAPRRFVRAVARDIVFRAYDVRTLIVVDQQGNSLLTSSGPNTGTTLHMCISNDLDMLPGRNSDASTELTHLAHLSAVALLREGRTFTAPKPINEGGGRTGDVICDGALFVYPPRG
jgi:hypothetical protein